MDINTAPRAELVRLVYEMADRIAVLEGEIARLKAEQHEKGKGTETGIQPPSFVKANKKKKKLQERKRREEAFTRKKERPTETVFHTEERCGDCGGKLGKPVVAYSRQIIDIPVSTYSVIEHVIFRRWCYQCKKSIQPNVDLSAQVVGKGRMGINLMATIVTMRERLRLPVGMIQGYLQLVYGLQVSKGEIVELLHTVASIGRPEYENLLTQVRLAKVVHADGQEDGKMG